MSFKESFLKAARKPHELYQCDGLGMEVGIKRLTSAELETIFVAVSGKQGDARASIKAQRKMVAACIVDPESGEQFLSEEDVKMSMDTDVVADLFEKAMKANGLAKGAVEEAGND